ncbi:MAG TPA: 5-oxoprolinase subunit PxpB [Burkholderiales bacterium]|nr:5-oxoprolinase subunit PxpB [Burkholderiales bacterium]
MRLLPNGDTALAVEFGDRIDRATSERVLALHDRVARAALSGVVELLPTFRSLMVHYDPARTTHAALADAIGPLAAGLEGVKPAARLWTIPVCYDLRFALDLEEVATRTGLTPAEVIEHHSGTTYHVYMIGFLPGYPYMGDLPARLALPRRENPRTQVPPGSVAIATTMTAVYTLASPGGWHILGCTPAALWSRRRTPPAVLAPGDKVRFAPIDMAEFERLAKAADSGEFALESTGA